MTNSIDFSFITDENTYEVAKKLFETYEDSDTGRGTISKGILTEGINSKECFQIKFMKHQSESWFSNKPMYKIYIRKLDCNILQPYTCPQSQQPPHSSVL